MSRQKEIEEFLELDKDDIELVEGIAACHGVYGRADGILTGKSIAWGEAVKVATVLHDMGKIDGDALAKFAGPFLRAVGVANKRCPRDAGTLTLERATWKVLKKRLRRARGGKGGEG